LTGRRKKGPLILLRRDPPLFHRKGAKEKVQRTFTRDRESVYLLRRRRGTPLRPKRVQKERWTSVPFEERKKEKGPRCSKGLGHAW